MIKFYILSILFICLAFVPLKGQGGSAYYRDTTIVQEAGEKDLEFLFQKARSLTDLGKDQAAILTYQEILKIDPRNETAYIELCDIAFRNENWAYSNTLMNKLVALNPEDSESRKVMMQVNRTFTVFSEEMKLVYELLQLNPSDTVLLNRLNTLYDFYSLHPEGAEVLESLIELVPTNKSYYIQLADLYFDLLGKMPKGIGTYKRYLALQPDDFEVLSILAFRYGETGNYSAQIECYQQIYDQAIDTIYWKEVLFKSYWQALRNYDFRFNIREARDQCEGFMEHRGDREDLRTLHGGLERAARPMINYRTTVRGYNFAGKTTHWKNALRIGFLGPFPGSSISVENNYLRIEQDCLPFVPGAYEPGLMRSHIYQGRVMFDQRFSKLSLHVDAGIHQPISGPSDIKTHFISKSNISYKPFENYSLTASYDLHTLTDNPVTISQQILQQDILLGMHYSFLKILYWPSQKNYDQNLLIDS